MTLGERQRLHAKCVGLLLIEIYRQGYEATLGDAFAIRRTPLEHKLNSNHYLKCAIDINLFKDGKYLKHTMAHMPFGKYWESLNPLCRWGGQYNDGNHYETLEEVWEK